MPEFSIVMTCFNHREFIGAAIQSALDQTFPAKEIIVVDDLSTDSSQQVLDTFADRITAIKNIQNVGPNQARNIGASRATGDYLVFLDGDDLFRREALAVYNRLANESNPVLILCNLEFFCDTLPSLSIPPGEPIEFVEYRRIHLKDRSYSSSASAIVVNREVFARAGGWTEVFPCEDTDLFLRVGPWGSAIQILSPHTALKRNHSANYSLNVKAMTEGMFKVLACEWTGRYKGESRCARYAFLGGPAFYWVKTNVSMSAWGAAVKMMWMSWPMILAGAIFRMTRAGARRSGIRRADLSVL